jgi:hypothetical protein
MLRFSFFKCFDEDFFVVELLLQFMNAHTLPSATHTPQLFVSVHARKQAFTSDLHLSFFWWHFKHETSCSTRMISRRIWTWKLFILKIITRKSWVESITVYIAFATLCFIYEPSNVQGIKTFVTGQLIDLVGTHYWLLSDFCMRHLQPRSYHTSSQSLVTRWKTRKYFLNKVIALICFFKM